MKWRNELLLFMSRAQRLCSDVQALQKLVANGAFRHDWSQINGPFVFKGISFLCRSLFRFLPIILLILLLMILVLLQYSSYSGGAVYCVFFKGYWTMLKYCIKTARFRSSQKNYEQFFCISALKKSTNRRKSLVTANSKPLYRKYFANWLTRRTHNFNKASR